MGEFLSGVAAGLAVAAVLAVVAAARRPLFVPLAGPHPEKDRYASRPEPRAGFFPEPQALDCKAHGSRLARASWRKLWRPIHARDRHGHEYVFMLPPGARGPGWFG
jgi:hypothetical protein